MVAVGAVVMKPLPGAAFGTKETGGVLWQLSHVVDVGK
jgi:hypothetical protein